MKWQNITDDFYRIMNKIPGGGWSAHTNEEYEEARIDLGISESMDGISERREGLRLWLELKKQLPETD